MPPLLLLHHVPDALLVMLSCWLGLSLLVRAPHDQGTRVFAWFCFHLALYGLGALLPQLTSSASAAAAFNRLQLIATVLSPTVFLHFIVILTATGYVPRTRRIIAGGFYLTASILALYAAFGVLPEPAQPFPVWSRWGEPRFPAGLLAWAWTAQRILPPLIALLFMARSYRATPHDVQEQRLRRIFAFTSLLGVSGAVGASLARDLPMTPALPRTMILVAMLALAYGVLVHRALLPARVARRTFFYSILGSLLTTASVGLVILLEALVDSWLQIDVPLVSALSLVVMIATVDPLREWFRRQLDQRFYRREFNYVHLVRSLSDDMREQGDLSDQLQAALSAICRALGIRAGLVVVAQPGGLAVLACYGQVTPLPAPEAIMVPDEPQWLDSSWETWPQARFLLPLRHGENRLGLLILGKQYVPQPLNASEQALLDYLNSYLSMAISHAHARDLQQDAIIALAEQSRALRDQQEHLARQAMIAAREEAAHHEQAASPADGLRVYALGPFRVERAEETITRWGGNKAGTHQAEALFAFLFDRRGKGITKDEVAQLIWPDLDIERADSAFHRTLAALRRTLEPELRRGNESRTILYHHERYWLTPSLIAWCDTEALRAAVESGITHFRQNKLDEAIRDLEHASSLYRGDYMDDCPFFGDSVYAEEQRRELQARAIDGQLALAAAYEARGRIGEAISAYRRAITLSADGCPPAAQGLARLQLLA